MTTLAAPERGAYFAAADSPTALDSAGVAAAEVAAGSALASSRRITVLRGAMLVAGKDLRAELRSRDILMSVGIFAILAVVIFNYAFAPGDESRQAVAPGIIWVAFIFAGLLGLNRSFAVEKEQGCIEGLMLCPVDREAIYLGKLFGNLAFMSVTEIVLLPLLGVLLQVDILRNPGGMAVVVVLGTIGFAVVGTLFAAITAGTRARDSLLPILLLPICLPVVIAAVKATTAIIGGAGIGGTGPWLKLLLGFDVLFGVLSFIVFEYVLEE